MPELALDLGSAKFWVFFAVALLLLVPITSVRLKQAALAAINVAFVASLVGGRGALTVLVVVVAIWLFARLLRRQALRRTALVVAAGLLLGVFLIHKLPPLQAGGLGTSSLKAVLGGIGFSFVALRVIEVLRASFELTQPAPGLIPLFNYVLPFHMLAAGPIQAYDDYVAASPIGDSPRVSNVLSATERIASGLFKKFVLAQTLKTLFLTGFQASGAYFFFEAQVYYVWVYWDFSAYSDIAVGVGQLLGIATPENFNRPLRSRNIIEFWERWHISLSLFIRRNVFVPIQLGLMRRFPEAKPLGIACAAFSVAFMLCGAWHGLNWRCLGWGAIHAFGLVVCSVYKDALLSRVGRKGLSRYLDDWRVRVLSTALTFEFVAFSLVFISYPFK